MIYLNTCLVFGLNIPIVSLDISNLFNRDERCDILISDWQVKGLNASFQADISIVEVQVTFYLPAYKVWWISTFFYLYVFVCVWTRKYKNEMS